MSETESSSSRPGSPTHTAVGGAGPSAARAFRFQWDGTPGGSASTNRPGPGSVASGTEGGRDYFISSNPRYTPSVIGGYVSGGAAAGAPAGTLPTEWSSSRHGFHAISTVLNHPHKSQAPPKAHSHLPAVAHADLPRVRRKDFDGYLRSVAPEWERFAKTLNSGSGEPSSILISAPSDPPTSPHTPDTARQAQQPQPIARTASLPQLDSVPAIFFSSSFDLSTPPTFTAVTNPPEGRPPDEPFDPLSPPHAPALLERLSHHADTVEQHLVSEIHSRAPSFFAALTNLNDLRTESTLSLQRVQTLRAQLASISEDSARPGLEAVRREVKFRQVEKVKKGVDGVRRVVGMTGEARDLVNSGKWADALGVVQQLEHAWEAGLSSPEKDIEPIPLSSLKAFAGLPEHLKTFTLEITTSLITDFVSMLSSDLSERINNGTEQTETLRSQLHPLVEGLVGTKSVMNALVKWREAALDEVISGILQRHLDTLGEEPDDEGLARASKLQAMTPSDFSSLMEPIYSDLLRCVEGIQAQNTLLSDMFTTTSHGPDQDLLPTISDELSDLIIAAAESANSSLARLIDARATQHTALSLPEFVAMFDSAWAFVVRCEVLCRRMIVGLRGTIVGQAKVFLQAFHQARLNTAAKLVEDELWNPADVEVDVQREVDILVECAVRDPPGLAIDSANTNETQTEGDGATTAAKHLKIEDRTYFAVPATLSTLGLLLDYARLVRALGTLAIDAMPRTVEFLKAFNSRTCQVVLGAGAMRSAGLKNITAKHLALASQSLSIVITLIPYVREMFRRHLSATQAVMLIEFDKLKRDYHEHQDEIHSKLIAIMGDRLTAHLRTLATVDWEAAATQAVNGYMELLVKETVTLHKVLSRYLALPMVEYIMSQVFASMTHRLAEAYGPIELYSTGAKQRMVQDAKYLHERLANLKGVRMPSNMLETIVMDKPILVHSLAPPPSSPLMSGLAHPTSPGSPGRPISPLQYQHQQQIQLQQQQASPPPQQMSANARIKGMFARATILNNAAAAFSTAGADVKRQLSPSPSPSPRREKPLPDVGDADLGHGGPHGNGNGYRMMDGSVSPGLGLAPGTGTGFPLERQRTLSSGYRNGSETPIPPPAPVDVEADV